MAGDGPNNLLTVKSTYTFNEAIDYLKQKDKNPTNIKESIRWVSVKTGKEVIIGYNN